MADLETEQIAGHQLATTTACKSHGPGSSLAVRTLMLVHIMRTTAVAVLLS